MTGMFMNQQFHRPLPIQGVMRVNKHENGTEPQSFPDPSCSLHSVEGALFEEPDRRKGLLPWTLGLSQDGHPTPSASAA